MTPQTTTASLPSGPPVAAAPTLPLPTRVTTVVKEAVKGFFENNALRLAAAISYTTAFSLSPLLVITVAVAGLFLGNQEAFVQARLVEEVGGLLGPSGGDLVRTLIENGRVNASGSMWATMVGLVVLVFSSTALFVQVQDALNTIWGLKSKPSGNAMGALVRARALSFGMVLMVAFLLLVSLLVSVAISAAVNALPYLGAGSEVLLRLVNFVVSGAIITLLFGLLFRFLPDAAIEWRDVWVGAVVTALLFNVGKLLIGLYLGHSSTESTFGAAGSVAVMLLWVYYSAVLLLFGAEITQAYATHFGSGVQPARAAVRVVLQEVEVDPSQAQFATTHDEKRLAEATARDLAHVVPASRPSLLRRAAPLAGLFLLGRFTRRSRRPKVTVRTGR